RHYRAEGRDKGVDRVQLFHVGEDPWELTDLSGDVSQRDRLNTLAATMTAWMRDVGDPFASIPVLLPGSGG
ncbi:hypothetical protein HN937_30725, partial [Candidatus Poribacteria bacterium]|nr:hypothetical protein [Candidatus Poribacteria bacterium]